MYVSIGNRWRDFINGIKFTASAQFDGWTSAFDQVDGLNTAGTGLELNGNATYRLKNAAVVHPWFSGGARKINFSYVTDAIIVNPRGTSNTNDAEPLALTNCKNIRVRELSRAFSVSGTTTTTVLQQIIGASNALRGRVIVTAQASDDSASAHFELPFSVRSTAGAAALVGSDTQLGGVSSGSALGIVIAVSGTRILFRYSGISGKDMTGFMTVEWDMA
jgi:hypothetical protein